jgi:putative (di)nucleoside polyphosphate hydrolase
MGQPDNSLPSETKLNQKPDSPSQQSDDLDLLSLIDAPEVRLLMAVDGVDREELIAMLGRVRIALATQAVVSPTFDESHYRPGVGIVLINERREIFMAQRSDVEHAAWQMPQGGIEPGETPQQAVLRELREEIGTNNATFALEAAHWIYYDVPTKLAQQAWGGRWAGQRQKWFLMAFQGNDTEIDLATEHPEFRDWQWTSPQTLIALAPPFKRQFYRSVFAQFDAFFRNDAWLCPSKALIELSGFPPKPGLPNYTVR